MCCFLSNYVTKSASRVMFNNMHYNLPPASCLLPPWSNRTLFDCRNVILNTVKVNFVPPLQVGVQTSQMEMLLSNADMISWETYSEDLSSLDDSSTFITFGLLEQINVTRGASDYLWYITSVDIGSSESFLRGGELPTLIVQSTGHALHVFINGQISVNEAELDMMMITTRLCLLHSSSRLPTMEKGFGWNDKTHVVTAPLGCIFQDLNQSEAYDDAK